MSYPIYDPKDVTQVIFEKLKDREVLHIGTTAPKDTGILWIDTGNSGVAKYYDTTSKAWKPIGSVWK